MQNARLLCKFTNHYVNLHSKYYIRNLLLKSVLLLLLLRQHFTTHTYIYVAHLMSPLHNFHLRLCRRWSDELHS